MEEGRALRNHASSEGTPNSSSLLLLYKFIYAKLLKVLLNMAGWCSSTEALVLHGMNASCKHHNDITLMVYCLLATNYG